MRQKEITTFLKLLSFSPSSAPQPDPIWGRHDGVGKYPKEVASMWWAQTGYKIAYAGIVGVWAVLMVMVFT